MPRLCTLILTGFAATAAAFALAAPAGSTFRGPAGDIAFLSTISETIPAPCTASPTRDCSSGGLPTMTRRFLVRVGADGALRGTLLVPTDFGEFRASPNGRRMAYGRTNAIYVSDITGRHARRIAREAYAPAWSPDGRRLAYTTNSHSVWVVGADGRGNHRLTAGSKDSGPRWSPDGRRIAFVRNVRREAGSPCELRSDLFSAPAVGGRARLLFHPDLRCAMVDAFDWAPSGERLVLAIRDALREDASADPRARGLVGLALIKPDGSGVRHIQPDGAYPVYAPDGRHIAFFGDRCRDDAEVGQIICSVRSDGRGLRRVTAVRDDIFAQFPLDWFARR